MRTTEEVWEHHGQAFGARDLSMVMEDFTDQSVMIVNGEIFKGLDSIREVFKAMFAELPKDCAFELPHCIILEKNVYITWNAESDKVKYEFATDTFTIENGKIALQTVGFMKTVK